MNIKTKDDAVSVAGDIHKIIQENDHVRILDVVVLPGAVAQMHSHPNNVVVVLTGGTLTFTNLEGVVKEAKFTPGQAFFGAANVHKVENKGNETVHVVQIELK